MKSIRLSHLVVIACALGLLLTVPTEGSAKWWDELGEPEYGGKITICQSSLDIAFDNMEISGGQLRIWYESLLWLDWTLDRNTFAFQTMWTPDQYFTGSLGVMHK